MAGQLSHNDLASRREFDWRVVMRMVTEIYQFTAHPTPQDAQDGTNPITTEQEARFALHYRARFNVRTLIGPGEYSPYTLIHVDISSPQYPFFEPVAWVIQRGESQLPFSPHFASNLPVCNGTVWRPDGNVLLGHYVIHLAKLLNWDEQLWPDYGGWNPAAVEWWKKNLNRPLTPDLTYPVMPADVAYGVEKPSGFRRFQARGRFEKVR